MVGSIVLQPLEMDSPYAFDPVLDPALLPKGYRHDSSGRIVTGLGYNTSWPSFIGAGGIISTSNDMMIYLEYNLGVLDTPLNSVLSALHTTSTKVTSPAASNSHSGGSSGFSQARAFSLYQKTWRIGIHHPGRLCAVNYHGRAGADQGIRRSGSEEDRQRPNDRLPSLANNQWFVADRRRPQRRPALAGHVSEIRV
jgi:CubicO group peptidase (beta-lactamase class C family)